MFKHSTVMTAEVLGGGTEPLKVPMAVSFAPNGQLLVVDTEPMIGLAGLDGYPIIGDSHPVWEPQ